MPGTAAPRRRDRAGAGCRPACSSRRARRPAPSSPTRPAERLRQREAHHRQGLPSPGAGKPFSAKARPCAATIRCWLSTSVPSTSKTTSLMAASGRCGADRSGCSAAGPGHGFRPGCTGCPGADPADRRPVPWIDLRIDLPARGSVRSRGGSGSGSGGACRRAARADARRGCRPRRSGGGARPGRSSPAGPARPPRRRWGRMRRGRLGRPDAACRLGAVRRLGRLARGCLCDRPGEAQGGEAGQHRELHASGSQAGEGSRDGSARRAAYEAAPPLAKTLSNAARRDSAS